MTAVMDDFYADEEMQLGGSIPEPTGRYDRYVLPDGPRNKGREFTRTTTIAGSLSSGFGLGVWTKYRAAWGVAQRDDLIARLRAVPVDDKDTLKEVCQTAETVAGVESGSNWGTACHAVLQRVDMGEPIENIHPYFHVLVHNYQAELARHGLVAIPQYVERVCRNTIFDCAGKFDNIYAEQCGRQVVGDKKTKGDPDADVMSVEMQEAIYANASLIMDYETGQYEPMPDVRKDYAIMVHIDQDTFEVNIHTVDIETGWAAVRVAMEMRELRKRKHQLKPYSVIGSTLNPAKAVEAPVPPATNGKPDPERVAAIAAATLAESHARRGFVPEAAAPAGPVVTNGEAETSQEAAKPAPQPPVTVGPTHNTTPPPRIDSPAAPVQGPDAEAEAKEIADAYARKPKSDLQAYAKRYGITDLAHHKLFIARLIVAERNKRRAAGLPGAIDDAQPMSQAVSEATAKARTNTDAGLGNAPAEPPGKPVVGPGTAHPITAGIDAQPTQDMTKESVEAQLRECKTVAEIGTIWQRWTDAYGRDSWGMVQPVADERANFLRQQAASGDDGVPF